ncbi:hypothetical protein HO133_010525 [Letharia lupina]|uniref:MHYT domain-containing protein n=1 Tax=Letharia lupina TaxID=560253 RepID=A0A8H6CIU8_9LECA|nr:uncharacterized protein HO133_010525 [Letharia lupina]KAF6223951.1 hypothetical protein HO133_010525 [Letharia lupina]
MGAVAIWSMHFIGNRAIVMANGKPDNQIQYSPGFTAGSFFLPVCVVGIAFYFFSVSEKVSILGTMVGGLLVGSAVCGMHYMGQKGIANYTPSYSWRHVFGSAIIAVAADTIALGVFFYLKSTWTNSWWKRMSCASLLAVSVSGMHWVATVGTAYRMRADMMQNTSGLSREATVVVVICLVRAVHTCLMRSADRAQQVVLACATFDPEERLMVTPEGLLPCCKITGSYHERYPKSFEEVFDMDHPVFCWIYRASRCWYGVSDLLPGMRSRLRDGKPFKHSRYRRRAGSVDDSTGDYSTLFKQLFCVAAKDLADIVQLPLEDVGVLDGTIMNTGTLSKSARLKLWQGLPTRHNQLDGAEKGRMPMIFGRGQLLFLVRRASRSQASHLQSTGYRFATISNVIEVLARSMEVTKAELLPQLKRMRDQSEAERLLEPGVHLGCFALRPVFHRGFDVLVRKDAGNLMPTSNLTKSKLEQWQIDVLQRMDNWTVATCCERLRRGSLFADPKQQQFSRELLESLTVLASRVDSAFFEEARLVATPLRAPCDVSKGNSSSQEAFVVAFRVITDAYQSSSLNNRYEFASLRFFLSQQHAHRDSADNAVFARRMHREFAAIASREDCDNNSLRCPRASYHPSLDPPCGNKRSRTPSPNRNKKWTSRIRANGNKVNDDNSSEKNLVNGSPKASARAFGEIHVANEIDIDVREVTRNSHTRDVEMSSLGCYAEAGVGDIEGESFADELAALTTDERRKQRTTGF